jgi:chromosome segregation ATPase
MSNDTQIRDAVIKLEAKMEVMTTSMVSMADSVAKLADLKFEIVSVKKDIAVLESRADKQEENIGDLLERNRQIEKVQDKNTNVISKIEVFWTALITGAAGFLWWLLKT